MCLGIPMQVIELKEGFARCSAQGVFRDVSTLLVGEPLAPGDFVMVHVGAALQKIDPQQAAEAWQTFSEIIQVLEGKASSVALNFATADLLKAPLSAPMQTFAAAPQPIATESSAKTADFGGSKREVPGA